MTELAVQIFSHHFAVGDMTPRGQQAVSGFARGNVLYGMVRQGGRWVRAPLKVFGAAFKDRSMYRFHINQLDQFKAYLKTQNIAEPQVSYDITPLKTFPPVDLAIKPEWHDREHQVPVIDYIARDEGPVSRFVDLQTGKGKSYCTMRGAAIMKVLATYLFRASYLEKWVIDIRKTYDMPEDGLMTVQGSAELMALLEMVRENRMPSKVLLISNKTFQNYLKLYEEFKDKILDMGYACTPPQFFEFVGCGLRVIDEVHQDFHLNFKIDLYTHVKRSVSLSATLISDDDFVINMHNIAYPPTERYQGPAYDKYVAVRNVFFQLRYPHKVRYIEPSSKRYSHNVFEHSIMRDTEMMFHYVTIFKRIIDTIYLKDWQEGDKMVIFCASIDFCTKMTEILKYHYTKLSVNRYVGSLNDPYENLMTSNLSVTTHGSAGTAVDIPQLTCVLMSQAMRSSPGSLQNLGRIRKLDNDRVAQYIFLMSPDIPQHLQYHEHRLRLLDGRAASIRSDHIGSV